MHETYYGNKARPVKELKPHKFEAQNKFERASYTYQGGHKVLINLLDYRRKVG